MNNKSFTLIELLVVTGIVVLITAMVLPNYRFGNRQLALQRSAHKIAQSLRTAQEYAVSAKEFAGVIPAGYGMYFDLDQPSSVILFADLDGDQRYSDSNEAVEEITLETGVVLAELNPVAADSSLTIAFVPPDPTVVFYPDNSISTVTLQAAGTQMVTTQYSYTYTSTISGWSAPRAACDLSNLTAECPNSFSALSSDPSLVYDQYRFLFFFNRSKRFTKGESQVVSVPEKNIEINKAGLIAVK